MINIFLASNTFIKKNNNKKTRNKNLAKMCLKQLINNFNTAWIKRTHQNSFKTNYKHHVLCSFCEHNSIIHFFVWREF